VLYAVNPDGSQKWASGEAGVDGIALGKDGTIYTVFADRSPDVHDEHDPALVLLDVPLVDFPGEI
jgi:hypothetical protein